MRTKYVVARTGGDYPTILGHCLIHDCAAEIFENGGIQCVHDLIVEDQTDDHEVEYLWRKVAAIVGEEQK